MSSFSREFLTHSAGQRGRIQEQAIERIGVSVTVTVRSLYVRSLCGLSAVSGYRIVLVTRERVTRRAADVCLGSLAAGIALPRLTAPVQLPRPPGVPLPHVPSRRGRGRPRPRSPARPPTQGFVPVCESRVLCEQGLSRTVVSRSRPLERESERASGRPYTSCSGLVSCVQATGLMLVRLTKHAAVNARRLRRRADEEG